MDADLVVTVSHMEGIGSYLSEERRWVVSCPQQHHDQSAKKEKATSNRLKRGIRNFKAARNRLVERGVHKEEDAPSSFIECPLDNVPDGTFKTGPSSNVHGHPRLAEKGAGQGVCVPERTGAAVRKRAGAVVCAEGAGIPYGSARTVGSGRLRIGPI